MKKKLKVLSVGWCLLILLMQSVVVVAAPRQVLRRVALREGPGGFYPVTTWIDRGETVDTGEVRGSWVRVKTLPNEGWLPQKAFIPLRKGIDYAGLLGSKKAVVISSVDIAAATKGAFETRYSEEKDADFSAVDRIEKLRVSPMRVALMLNDLKPAKRPVARALPMPVYRNNVIVNEDAEQLLGRAITATLMKPGLTDDTDKLKYVNEVAAVVGMYSGRYELPYHVAIIKDDAIGGYGIPGGYIVLTEGLLREVRSEAELACLLGHEMAHICLYHGLREFNKRGTHRKSDAAFAELDAATSGGAGDAFAELDDLSGATNTAAIEQDLNRLANTSYLKIIGKRSRADELEADLYGAAFAADAGYDPRAFVRYLERIKKQGEIHDSFRHHPPLDARIAALKVGIRRYHMVRRGQVNNTIGCGN